METMERKTPRFTHGVTSRAAAGADTTPIRSDSHHLGRRFATAEDLGE